MMKAIVLASPGDPTALQIQEIAKPLPRFGTADATRTGWVLIKVKAFGLNRSEMFTCQGHSPSVQLPRVLGIECVGLVEAHQYMESNQAKGKLVVLVNESKEEGDHDQ